MISPFRFAHLAWIAFTATTINCGADDPGTTATFRLMAPPAPNFSGRCPASAGFGSLEALPEQPSTARLTYREAGNGALICDVVIPLTEPPSVAVPNGPAADIFVELYRNSAGSPQRVAAGRALGVDVDRGGEIQLPVLPSGRFSCAARGMSTARAFHSATVLPDGRVLLIGGLVANTAGATDIVELTGEDGAFYVTDAVELYDPSSRSYTALSIPGLVPRAMHNAFLVPDGDATVVTILLVGGVTANGDASTNPVARPATATDLVPIEATAQAIAAPTEVLVLDPSTATITRTVPTTAATPRLFAAYAGASDHQQVVAGGWSDVATHTPEATIQGIGGLSPSSYTIDLAVPRFGATITEITPTAAIIWGGQLGATSPATVAGELLDTSATPVSAVIAVDVSMTSPIPRAFHAAARSGDRDLVIAGGYAIAGPRALTQTAVFAERLPTAGVIAVEQVPTATQVPPEPAGFLTASPLTNGDILIAGGNAVCEAQSEPLLCATDQAYRYQDDLNQLTAVPDGLVVARYGHAAVGLADGAVLITGGLLADAQGLRVVADAEQYSPDEQGDDPIADLGYNRAPGDIARTGDGTPIAECPTVTRETDQL